MELLLILLGFIFIIYIWVSANRGVGITSHNPSFIVVGQIHDKNTGLGKAINDVIDYSRNKLGEDYIETLDITDNKQIFKSLWLIWRSNSPVIYFTPAGSKFGNLRDALIIFFGHFSGKKIVLHFHNSNLGRLIESSDILLRLNRYLYQYIDRIIILGETQKNMFKQLDLKNEIFSIIPNAVNSDLFIDHREFSKKSGNKIIYFSNMLIEKGYNLVLELTKVMKDTDFEFTFSGKFYDETLRLEFEKEITKLNNVTYVPGVYGADKKELLKEMDYFILPSRYKDETLPISMLEAMANGMFILVTPVGVITEYTNPSTSYLIESDEVRDWARVIQENYRVHDYEDFNIKYLKSRHDYSSINKEIISVIQGTL